MRWLARLRPRVIDGLNDQVESILVAAQGAAIFGAAITEHTIHGNLVLLLRCSPK